MFGKIAKKSTGAVYNQTFCVSHDDFRENKSVCRVEVAYNAKGGDGAGES